MAVTGGIVFNALSTVHKFAVNSGIFPGVLSQVRHYAARKGTREKAKKKKTAKIIKKLTFAEKVTRSKKIHIIKPDALLYPQDNKIESVDDVYNEKFVKWKRYSFEEAIQCHRETYHPTIFDAPESIVSILVELNMQGVKKKPVEQFNKLITVKHPFDHGENRTVLVFAKEDSDIKIALDNGATLAGGSDTIKSIMDGNISLNEYDIVIAHPQMMPEILTIRGLLKKKHPNIKSGTLGVDIKSMLYSQLYGIKYSAIPYKHFPEYGLTTIPIGKLNMEIKHLEDNMQAALDSIMSAKPKRPGSFITRVRIVCPPINEKFTIDHTLYIEDKEPVSKKNDKQDELVEDETEYAVPIPNC